MRKMKKGGVTKERIGEVKRTHLFDGAACFFLPLLAAELQRAVNVGFSVVRAQDEESENI